MHEVDVCREQGEVATDAQRREECVDRAELYAVRSTAIADVGCRDVIVPVGLYERDGPETLGDQPA